MNDKQLAVLLTCFPGAKAAGAAHRSLVTRLETQGDAVVQTTVVRVNASHHASLHDARRVLQGTLTAALTWGAFGLVAGTNKVESTVIWAVLGAICGGLYAYLSEHLLGKDELARLGKRLPAPSSALLTYVRTDDAGRLLQATAPASPSTASAAVIAPNLVARVYAGASMPVELPRGSAGGGTRANEISLLSMALVRYPDTSTAHQVAARAARSAGGGSPRVELVIETGPNGRRRVVDPTQGVAAWAKSDVISWGGFGVVFGCVVGLVGGGGILGFLEDGLATGLGWALFGLAAGALYGLWAGRSISARRLSGVGELLPHGSSALLAWADGPLREGALGGFDAPGAERLVLSFNPTDGGAVLEAV